MLKSKEHVEQRRFSYHSLNRSGTDPTANREPILPPTPSGLSGQPQSPTPSQVRSATDSLGEVVLEKRTTGFFDASGAAVMQLFAAVQGFLREQVAPIRLASHLAVLIVGTMVVVVSRMDLPALDFPLHTLPADGLLADNAAADKELISSNPFARVGEALQVAIRPSSKQKIDEPAIAASEAQSASAESAAPAAPAKVDVIRIYEVRSGDNLQKIAAQYGLRPETIQWANEELESNPDLLRVGQRLVIPPVDGVLHAVRPGDTLLSLATKFKAEVSDIVTHPMNKLASADTPVTVGSHLIIPHGTKPYVARQVAIYRGPIPASAARGTGRFVWPVGGLVTQRYWHGHRAIDVGARTGAPIVAADSGFVVKASHGWNGGYGRMVMIDHGNGVVSLYAHMNTIYVRQGENIAKGAQLGTVGNTGRSTGPHLHFEIRHNGVARNPFYYLP